MGRLNRYREAVKAYEDIRRESTWTHFDVSAENSRLSDKAKEWLAESAVVFLGSGEFMHKAEEDAKRRLLTIAENEAFEARQLLMTLQKRQHVWANDVPWGEEGREFDDAILSPPASQLAQPYDRED